jgi:alkanesulfonate monooxygenase SsuD/methylene tetrahydromethanopterin reductase-like flavin-dependent oxidoreductase (luciferase family)
VVPLSIPELVPITFGSTAKAALENSLDLARHAERLGYHRFWVAEHHNMTGIASAATAVVVGYLAVPLWILGSSTFGAQLAAMLGLPYAFASWAPAEKSSASRMLAHSFVGSPETVRAGLERFVGATQADELMVVAAIYDHEQRVRSYELLAEVAGDRDAAHAGWSAG